MKPTATDLELILALHAKWRRGENGGSRADLADANLAGANLAGAYLAGANLADADLAGADLAGANLAGANLAGADLAGANLADADLADANLAGAYLAGANLADAYLADAYLAGAYLADADLAGAYLADADLADANLAGADLAGAYLADADLADADHLPAGVEAKDPPEPYVRASHDYAAYAARYRARHPDVPVVDRLDSRILDAITAGGGLDMSRWHTCETTHCRAGWAITLAGEPGRKLEDKHGPRIAGAMIYRASTGRSPHFFATNERALEHIRACAAQEGDR